MLGRQKFAAARTRKFALHGRIRLDFHFPCRASIVGARGSATRAYYNAIARLYLDDITRGLPRVLACRARPANKIITHMPARLFMRISGHVGAGVLWKVRARENSSVG